MIHIKNPLFHLFRGLALVTVVVLGLLSIIATQSSSKDDPAEFFADAGRDQSVPDSEWVQLDGTGSDTPLSQLRDNEQVIYLWSVISSPPKPDLFPFPETYQLENATTIRPRIVPIVAGEYVVQLEVRFGSKKAWDNVSIFASEGPPASNARAGADRFVKHGTLVQLDGSQSYSVFEDQGQFSDMPLQFSWFMNQQPAGTSSSLSTTNTVNPGFIAEYNADDVSVSRPRHSLYETRLHVINDNGLVSDPVHVKTYVYPPEGYIYPTPMVGSDQKVVTGATVQLDGSDSYDVDGRSLDYDWEFYARPTGSTASLSGADTATPSFVADRDGIYVVQLQVSNEELSSIRLGPRDGDFSRWGPLDYAGTDRVVISAFSGSARSMTDAGTDQLLSFSGPEAIPLDGSGSYDINDDQITYHWFLMDAPQGSVATIDTPQDTEPDSASLMADMAGTYLVGLNTEVHQGDYNLGNYKNDHVVITLTDNNAPAADAGVDQSVNVGELVMLDAGSSGDTDADPLGYSWSLASAPGTWGYVDVGGVATWHDWPMLSNGMDEEPTFTPNRNGEYRLLLTVNDGEQSSAMDEVIITAAGSPVNTPPVADAGADQTVTVGATVDLDGSASSDAENTPLTYLWNIEARPQGSSAALDDPSSETPSFVADFEGSYTVQLIVNDGTDISNPDSMMVTAQTASACATPLNLLTSLPFPSPPVGEMPTNIRIDGTDLSAVTGGGMILDTDVYQAIIPDSNNPDQADFVILVPTTWEEVSSTHSNPIADSASPSFIVRNISDDIYYKLDVEFTGTNMLEVQIDALSGCRCGASAGDCPS